MNMNELTPVKFNEEIVITTKTLAQVYECEEANISNNFKRNENKFIEGKHYYKLTGKELKEFKTNHLNDDPSMLRINCLYLWTKRGASRHCKMLGTDKAWEMFDSLEENYFNPKLPQFTDKQLLQLKILNGDELESAIALKEYEQMITKPLLEKIEEDKPKVDVYERFINSDFTYTATSLKGIFGFPSAVAMNKKLHELKLIYKPGNSKKWTAYKDTPKEWYKVLATEFGDTLRWSPEGIIGIADLLDVKISEGDIENLIEKDE